MRENEFEPWIIHIAPLLVGTNRSHQFLLLHFTIVWSRIIISEICRIFFTCRSHRDRKKTQNFQEFSNLFMHVAICDQFLIIISHVASVISFFPKLIHNEKRSSKRGKNSLEKNPLCLSWFVLVHFYNKELCFRGRAKFAVFTTCIDENATVTSFYVLITSVQQKCWIFVVCTRFDFPSGDFFSLQQKCFKILKE